MLSERSITQEYIMYDSSDLLVFFLVLEQAKPIFDEYSQNSDCLWGWEKGFTGEEFEGTFWSDRDLGSRIVKTHQMLHLELVHFTC